VNKIGVKMSEWELESKVIKERIKKETIKTCGNNINYFSKYLEEMKTLVDNIPVESVNISRLRSIISPLEANVDSLAKCGIDVSRTSRKLTNTRIVLDNIIHLKEYEPKIENYTERIHDQYRELSTLLYQLRNSFDSMIESD
jgi:hypothetical protein